MDSRTLSRWTGAFCLVVPLLANVVMHLTDPLTGDSAQEVLRQATAHPGAASLQYLKLLLLLQCPAALYVARLARSGSPNLATWGAGLTVLSVFLQVPNQLERPMVLVAGGRQDYAGYLDAYAASGLLGNTIALSALCQLIGFMLLGSALWRSRAIPRWAALTVALVGLLNPVAHVIGIAWLVTAVMVLWLAVYGVSAVRLLGLSNEEFEPRPAALERSVTVPAAILAG